MRAWKFITRLFKQSSLTSLPFEKNPNIHLRPVQKFPTSITEIGKLSTAILHDVHRKTRNLY